jgi:PEP-CTERM motif-containing protein
VVKKILLVILACLAIAIPKLLWADQVFAAEFNQGNNRFGTIDLSTGIFTQLGSYGGIIINDIAYAPDGSLYGIENSATLVTFNESNGAITPVANFNVGGIETLAFDPTNGDLFAATQSSLYTLNLSTAQATLIGGFGPAPGLGASGQNIRFAADDNLYVTNTSTDGISTDLYRLDLTSGNATFLGGVVSYPNLVLANAGHDMYGVSVNVSAPGGTQQTLLTFDLGSLGDGSSPHNIAATPLNGTANIPQNFNFSGSQAASVVPEPSSLALIAAGFCALIIFLRKKKRS